MADTVTIFSDIFITKETINSNIVIYVNDMRTINSNLCIFTVNTNIINSNMYIINTGRVEPYPSMREFNNIHSTDGKGHFEIQGI